VQENLKFHYKFESSCRSIGFITTVFPSEFCTVKLSHWVTLIKYNSLNTLDRFCGLVVRVLGYRYEGPGSIPGTTRFSGGEGVVGLERGPLSLVSTTEELLDRKVAAPV
jgi:hypothetical protein